MLAAAGQPLEVSRTIRDVEGDPHDPEVLPGCVATQTGLPPVDAAVRALGDGVYAARVPGAMLSTLGVVALGWSWEYEGDPYTATDRVDVTTVPVATVDDIEALPGDGARLSEPLAVRLAALSAATRAFESAVNETFSPRLRAERGIADDGRMRLTGARPTELRAVQVAGEDVDVAGLRIDPVWDALLLPGVSDGAAVEVTYVHGMDHPPEYVTRAVAILATSMIAEGPFDDRGVALQTEGGFARLLTAGVGRAMFSIPEVEAAARRARRPVFA